MRDQRAKEDMNKGTWNSSFTVPFPKERSAGMAPGCQFYMMNEHHVKTASVQGGN